MGLIALRIVTALLGIAILCRQCALILTVLLPLLLGLLAMDILVPRIQCVTRAFAIPSRRDYAQVRLALLLNYLAMLLNAMGYLVVVV